MAHGLDGFFLILLIFFFGFIGTRIGRIFSDFNFIRKNQRKSVKIRPIRVPFTSRRLQSASIKRSPTVPSTPSSNPQCGAKR